MRSKDKKLVSIIWGYSEETYGLSLEENYHLHLLKVAKESGFSPYVIIRGSKERIERDPNFDPDIKVIDYENALHFFFHVLKFSFQGSVFYVNSYVWQSFAVPFLARRTIFMAHSQPKRKTKIKQLLQNFVYSFFSAIRLNNEDEKKFLIEQGVCESKLFVVPLIVSQNIFKLNKMDERRKDLVYFGNVTPVKNLSTVLAAFKTVLLQKHDIKLNIIGKIADDNFAAKVAELGLEENVVLHGYMPQDEKLTKLLNSFLVSINSSLSEGQCVSVYDSALCGCVLCLPRIMSFRGVFDGCALFHDVYNYEELAQNILFYLNNPLLVEENRMKGVEMIKNKYSKDTIEKRLHAMLLKI